VSGFTQLRFLIGASLAFVMGAATAVDAQTTALRGARVIDGSGGAAIDNAVHPAVRAQLEQIQVDFTHSLHA